MKASFNQLHLPENYTRIKVVHSFEELVKTPLDHGINALCWQRALEGDFIEIVEKLTKSEKILSLNEELLNQLSLSEQGDIARKTLIADKQLLSDKGLDPTLDCISAYSRDEESDPFPTDVYSFHADSANVIADTYLCSYTGAASEGIRNQDVIRHADIPETRAKLLKLHEGEDDESFVEFLKENYFNLHYFQKPETTPFSFGFGNLWRIANQCPGNPVPPCIHRAPTTDKGDAPRLLLIS